MKSSIIHKILGCYMFFFISTLGLAQNAIEIDIQFYHNLVDNTIRIEAIVIDEDSEEGIKGLQVQFFTHIDSIENKLGDLITDIHGIAILDEISFDRLLLDSSHSFAITAEFKGNDQYTSRSKTLEHQELNINISYEVIDSVNTAFVQVNSWDKQGGLVPVEEAEVMFYVQRMFSLLPIGETYTNEEGKDKLKFPNDLPGTENMLSVIAQIEDSDDYGNVILTQDVNWGIANRPVGSELPRALWSPRPPWWMIITFVLLMSAVWGHYAFVIFELWNVKRASTSTVKNLNKTSEV